MKMKLTFLCTCLCLLVTVCAFAQETVLYVNGEPILQSELDLKVKNSKVFNTQASTGLSEEEITQRNQRMYQEALMSLISERALIQEAEKRGLTLDNDAVKALADQQYQETIASVERYVLSSYPGLAGEELETQVKSVLASSGNSLENYRALSERSAMLAVLDAQLLEEAEGPDDAAVQAYYDALYEEQRELFTHDQNAFEAALLQKQIVVYRPVALKMIQKAEFLFEDGAFALISQMATMNPQKAEDMREDQYGKIEAKVEEARQQVLGGKTTFAEVMESCKEGSSAVVNYFHENSTRFNEDYYSRAAAFEKVGEISTAYRMPNGYAVLCYAGDLPACDRVPLEEVRESILEALSEQMRLEILKEARTQIVVNAQITYPEGETK